MRRLKAIARRWFRRAACWIRPRTLVLAYHHVCEPGRVAPWLNVPPEQFAEHMAYLSRTGLATSLDEFLQGLRTGRPGRGGRVMVTFDDAGLDTLEVAYPILKRYGVPATLFVPTGLIGSGRPFWWNRLERLTSTARDRGIDLARLHPSRGDWRAVRLLDEDEREKLLADWTALLGPTTDAPGIVPMNWDQLARLDQSGLFTLGAHSVSHPVLGALPDERVIAEITESREALRGFASFRNVFASPYGDAAAFTDRVRGLLRQAGYEAAFSTEPVAVHGGEDPLALGRLCLDATPLDEFAYLIDHYLSR